MKIVNYFLVGLLYLPINSWASHAILPGLQCASISLEEDNNAQLCVINLFGETEWFIFSDAGNRRLKIVPNSMLIVSEFIVSPSQQYVAINSVGEGHPIIDIIELKNLLDDKEPNILISINPYPGVVNMVGWVGEKLLVTSDSLISDKNQILEIEKTFQVDIARRKITVLTPR